MVIGLTGPTGAGKSTVSKIFSENGFYVIDADKISREATKKGSPILFKLCKAFGDDIIDENGELKRSLLAERAFSSDEKTAVLNGIVHPFVVAESERIISRLKENGTDIIIDAPLLFEAGMDKLCDECVCVTADDEIRLERIIKRDSISPSLAKSRMNAQPPCQYYIDKCRYNIVNNDSEMNARAAALSVINDIKKEFC